MVDILETDTKFNGQNEGLVCQLSRHMYLCETRPETGVEGMPKWAAPLVDPGVSVKVYNKKH